MSDKKIEEFEYNELEREKLCPTDPPGLIIDDNYTGDHDMCFSEYVKIDDNDPDITYSEVDNPLSIHDNYDDGDNLIKDAITYDGEGIQFSDVIHTWHLRDNDPLLSFQKVRYIAEIFFDYTDANGVIHRSYQDHYKSYKIYWNNGYHQKWEYVLDEDGKHILYPNDGKLKIENEIVTVYPRLVAEIDEMNGNYVLNPNYKHDQNNTLDEYYAARYNLELTRIINEEEVPDARMYAVRFLYRKEYIGTTYTPPKFEESDYEKGYFWDELELSEEESRYPLGVDLSYLESEVTLPNPVIILINALTIEQKHFYPTYKLHISRVDSDASDAKKEWDSAYEAWEKSLDKDFVENWNKGYCAGTKPPLVSIFPGGSSPAIIDYCVDGKILWNKDSRTGRRLSDVRTKEGILKPIIPSIIPEPKEGENPDAPLFQFESYDWTYKNDWEIKDPVTSNGNEHANNLCICGLPGYRDILLNIKGTTTLEQALQIPELVYNLPLNNDDNDLERSILRWGSGFLPYILEKTPNNYSKLIDTTSFIQAIDQIQYLYDIGIPSHKLDQTVIYHNHFFPNLLEFVPEGMVTIMCEYDYEEEELQKVKDTIAWISADPYQHEDIIFKYGENCLLFLMDNASKTYFDLKSCHTTFEDATSIVHYLQEHCLLPETIDDILLQYGQQFLPNILEHNSGISKELSNPDLTMNEAVMIMNYISTFPLEQQTIDDILKRYAARYADELWLFKPEIYDNLSIVESIYEAEEILGYLKSNNVPPDIIDIMIFRYAERFLPELLTKNPFGIYQKLSDPNTDLNLLKDDILIIYNEKISIGIIELILLKYGYHHVVQGLKFTEGLGGIYDDLINPQTSLEVIKEHIRYIESFSSVETKYLIDDIIFLYSKHFLPYVFENTNGIYRDLTFPETTLSDAETIINNFSKYNIEPPVLDTIIMNYSKRFLPQLFSINSEIVSILQNPDSPTSEINRIVMKMQNNTLSDDLIDDIILTYGEIQMPDIFVHVKGMYESLQNENTEQEELIKIIHKLQQYNISTPIIDDIVMLHGRVHLPKILESVGGFYNTLVNIDSSYDEIERHIKRAIELGVPGEMIDSIVILYGQWHFPIALKATYSSGGIYDILTQEYSSPDQLQYAITFMVENKLPIKLIDDVLMLYAHYYLPEILELTVGLEGIYDKLVNIETSPAEIVSIVNSLKKNNVSNELIDRIFYKYGLNHILSYIEHSEWIYPLLQNPDTSDEQIVEILQDMKKQNVPPNTIDLVLLNYAQLHHPEIFELTYGFEGIYDKLKQPSTSKEDIIETMEIIVSSNISRDMIDILILKYARQHLPYVLESTVGVNGIYDTLQNTHSDADDIESVIVQMDQSLISPDMIDEIIIKYGQSHLPYALEYHDGMIYNISNNISSTSDVIGYIFKLREFGTPDHIIREIIYDFGTDNYLLNVIPHLGPPFDKLNKLITYEEGQEIVRTLVSEEVSEYWIDRIIVKYMFNHMVALREYLTEILK